METPRIVDSIEEQEWATLNTKKFVLGNEVLVSATYEPRSEYRHPHYTLEWKTHTSPSDIVKNLENVVSYYENEGGSSVEKTASYMKYTYSAKDNSVFNEAEIYPAADASSITYEPHLKRI